MRCNSKINNGNRRCKKKACKGGTLCSIHREKTSLCSICKLTPAEQLSCCSAHVHLSCLVKTGSSECINCHVEVDLSKTKRAELNKYKRRLVIAANLAIKSNTNLPVAKSDATNRVIIEREMCCVCVDETNFPQALGTCQHFIHKNCIILSGKQQCSICQVPVNLTRRQIDRLEARSRKFKRLNLEEEAEEIQEFEEERHRRYHLIRNNCPAGYFIRWYVNDETSTILYAYLRRPGFFG